MQFAIPDGFCNEQSNRKLTTLCFCSRVDWEHLDEVTWPEFVLAYLAATRFFSSSPHKATFSRTLPRKEHYALPPEAKLEVLSFLCNEALDSGRIRKAIAEREKRQNDVIFRPAPAGSGGRAVSPAEKSASEAEKQPEVSAKNLKSPVGGSAAKPPKASPVNPNRTARTTGRLTRFAAKESSELAPFRPAALSQDKATDGPKLGTVAGEMSTEVAGQPAQILGEVQPTEGPDDKTDVRMSEGSVVVGRQQPEVGAQDGSANGEKAVLSSEGAVLVSVDASPDREGERPDVHSGQKGPPAVSSEGTKGESNSSGADGAVGDSGKGEQGVSNGVPAQGITADGATTLMNNAAVVENEKAADGPEGLPTSATDLQTSSLGSFRETVRASNTVGGSSPATQAVSLKPNESYQTASPKLVGTVTDDPASTEPASAPARQASDPSKPVPNTTQSAMKPSSTTAKPAPTASPSPKPAPTPKTPKPREEDSEDANLDECALCGMEGNLLCCDGCPAAYHARCVGLGRAQLPEGAWYCPECRVTGVNRKDPALLGVRIDPLGTDVQGREYWFAFGSVLM
jgi:hypothetical protein